MEWEKLYNENSPPSFRDVEAFIGSALWPQINAYLQDTYGVQPKLTYSRCSMQRGWNIKYQKSGRALCTLYPMEGFFIALVVIGEKEAQEAELLLPTCCEYTQSLYHHTVAAMGQRWLMLNVTGTAVLEDVKSLIRLRLTPKPTR